MSTTLKKTLAGVAVLGFLALGFVTPAKAATIEELQALIADLQAQLAALSGGSMTSCTSYGVSAVVRQGMSGANVTAVQRAVNHTGAATLSTDGVFGPATKAGVMAAQVKVGAAADGVWGPNTQAKYQAWVASSCSESSNGLNGSSSNGSLSGDIGSINSYSALGQYNSEDVGEGEEDVPVAGWELDTDDGSDIRLVSTKLTFTGTSNTGSKVLTKYADEVSVWLDGEEIGRIDASDFSKSSTGIYTGTIALDSSAIIRAGHKGEFVIRVSAKSTIDSSDLSGDAWTVAATTVRYEDASGALLTDTTGVSAITMDFVTFSSAADTKLKVSIDTDSPDAGIVVVDDTNNTDNVTLLKGKLKLEGVSDVNIDVFPVTITSTEATNVDQVANSLTLILDGEEFTETVASGSGTSTTISFDDLDFDLSAGDTVEFEILADINDIETGYFEEGDNLKASVTTTNRNQMDVTNDEGDQLDTSSERSGSAIGDYQEFRTQGIALTLLDTTAVSSNDTGSNNDTGTFTIQFKVTAVGEDAYLATQVASGFTYTVDYAGTTTTVGVSAVITNDTDTDQTTGENWLIEEGTSENLTLTVSKVNSSGSLPTAGLYRANLTGVRWDDDDTGSSTPDNIYTSNLDAFHTAYVSLN